TAEPKVEIVVPVASWNEFIRVFEGPCIEHRRLRDCQNISSGSYCMGVASALGQRILAGGLAKDVRRNGNESQRLPYNAVEICRVIRLCGAPGFGQPFRIVQQVFDD